MAYYYSGRMCHLLRDYACAAANFQTVAEGWPDYQYAGGAQCAVGYCYAAMVKLGEIGEAEAQPVIEDAYEKVLEQYPDCYLADYAAFQLGEMNFARGDWATSEQYYKLFLELARPGDARLKMVQARIKELEEMVK